ncbi:unnamed protein product, partial [Bemisia tabaci]
ALDTTNVTVKKQVFELLSALCVYNADGYTRALEVLEQYKILKDERYRLKVVVVELQNATTVDYQTSLVAFINCLIISTPQLKDRIRIRNEFIGLKLLSIINELRRAASEYPDLAVQLDVFDEQRESDEAQILDAPYGVDLNSHLDVFYAILRQVSDTPQEIPFLSILQHLLRIDPKEAVSDIVWDTAETLVHRATLLETRQDATRLLRSPSVQSKLCCHSHRGDACGSRKQSLNNTPGGGGVTSPTPSSAPTTITLGPPPPPPPPPPGGGPLPPPPPPPAPAPPPAPPPGILGAPASKMGAPPMPPPLIAPQAPASRTPEPPEAANAKLLPQQETPTPKTKMKTINWNKIPNNKVIGKHNIWSLVARSHEHSPMADLDWAEMEGLFCQQAPPPTAGNVVSPRATKDSPDHEKRRKEPSEITLLDGKRSLNVNIFLKQFRSSNEDIIQLIKDGEHDDIGAEKLRGLLKLLPEVDEIEMLRGFDDDRSKLGNAEKFLLQLIEVPNYKLRIESMLLKEEFAANMSYLEPSINAMIVAGEDLMTKKPLQEVLYMVICAGNFLNSGGYAGNAAGVKLSSLQKLTDIRANKPGMNLIHYVALQAEKKRKDLLSFPNEMVALEEATKTSVEQLQNEINALDGRIKTIRRQIELPTTEPEIKNQMLDFLNVAEQDVSALHRDMQELENVRRSLAEFFCEDVKTFKVEECFKVFHSFCVKFKQAVMENERRKLQEEQASARRRQREEQLAVKRKLSGHFVSNGSESDSNVVENILSDIRSGFPQKKQCDKDVQNRRMVNGCSITSEEEVSMTGSPSLSRRRLGSSSNDPNITSSREDNYSPSTSQDQDLKDITPTGSLRRRRSRVPSEEDESTLMDFLRASGHGDGSRERKSWGSLDRSWARRARGQGRKRPELLTADFSGDRERSNSPSPSTENKPIVSDAPPEDEPKPKAWRQKIESWLQDNEKEEKQAASKSDDIRRRAQRLQNNRRSLEQNDSESDRGTLDTLPEGKLANNTANSQYKRVYSDWRPSIDKNVDVVGVMEAIAGTQSQPQTNVKDKTPWRKSNLNSSNLVEESDNRRLRRSNSRGSSFESPSLQAIKEEEKRKGLIGNLGQDTSDSLTVYLRRPSDPPDASSTSARLRAGKVSPLLARRVLPSLDTPPRSPEDQHHLPPFSSPSRLRSDSLVQDKVEIDSDNIETPPATRKLIRVGREPERASTRSSSPRKKDDEEVLGDGQFDRFSSARRTRRYRKSLEEERPEGGAWENLGDKLVKSTDAPPVGVDTESRLRQWQDRLKYKGNEEQAMEIITRSGEELKNIGQQRVSLDEMRDSSKPGKHRTVISINGEDKDKPYLGRDYKTDREMRQSHRASHGHGSFLDQEAKFAPTSIKIQNRDSAARHRNEFIPEIKVQALTPSKQKENDLNDEGFEETQSLNSQSTNNETDGVDSAHKTFNRTDSSDSAPSRPVSRSLSLRNRISSDSSAPKRTPSLRRTDSLSKPRTPTPAESTLRRKLGSNQDINSSSNNINKINNINSSRTNLKLSNLSDKSNLLIKNAKNSSGDLRKPSLARTNSQRSVLKTSNIKVEPRKKVERSNSRSSLRSSRSSLNSATSVSTVRNLQPGAGLRNYTNAMKSDPGKPLAPVQLKSRSSVPASRSSSSGSNSSVSATPVASTVKRPKISSGLSTSFKENSGTAALRSGSISNQGSRATSSFMRPTASTQAKNTADNPKPKVTTSRLTFK